MKFNFLLKSVSVIACIIAVVSCDKDYNQIGADVLGNNDHYGVIADSTSTTIAYNQETGPVQTNNLPVNTLGFYRNDVFGTSTSNFITQVSLASVSPTFVDLPANIVVDSVYMHVPYFYTPVSIDETTGDTAYRADSLIGSSKIKVDVYRSGFVLESLDSSPGSGLTEAKKYFSDDNFSTSLVSSRLNNGIAAENDNFEFKNTQIKFYKNAPNATTVRERLAPGLFMMLDKAYFKSAIIEANPTVLSNNTLFRDYFRGLYFKVSPSPSDPGAKGALNRLNFAQGKITIVYTDKTSSTNAALIRKTMVINLSGNTVNTFENSFNPTYASKLLPSYNSTTAGSDRLYLKGGNGSMAVISLFGGKTNDANNAEIQKFRNEKALISDASLTFTIDKTFGAMNTEVEPVRLYLFDLENRSPLVDYVSDFTSSTNTKLNKFIHGGIIKLNSNSRGKTYQIKLTNHVQNLVRDVNNKNVKLGLVITESINILGSYGIKNPFSYLTNSSSTAGVNTVANSIPVMAFPNPLGTIFYGSSSNVIEAKRLKLVIRYTKPD